MKKRQIKKKALTRDYLLSLQENSKSVTIDLTEYNLTSFDFSNIKLRNIIFSDFHKNQLIDLSNTIFKNCEIVDCKFSGAIFKGTTFRGSNLKWCDFRYARFEQTTFSHSNLFGCDFYRSEFEGYNVFEEARLKGVSLFMANLEGAGIRKDNLCGFLLQEDENLFKEFHIHFSNVPLTEMKIYINKRFHEAMLVYRFLMGLWVSKGFLKDAGWAYVKSKRMEKKTFAPWRSLKIYDKNNEKLTMISSLFEKSGIIFKCFPKFIGYWFVDMICGFGESISKVIFSIISVLFIGALFYSNMQGVVDANGIVNTNFIDNLLFSLANMTSTNFERLRPANQFIEIMLAVQSFIGIALVGLLGFILGNKIRSS